MFNPRQTRECIRCSSLLILLLVLVSCASTPTDESAHESASSPSAKDVLDDVARFAEGVLGDRLRVHHAEFQRGNVGVESLFRGEGMIGYTTFSGDLHQPERNLVDLEDCLLFAAEYDNQGSAEGAFDFLKSNAAIPASVFEGMVGPAPVQVRFLERVRRTGNGGLLTQQGSYVFFLVETGEGPPAAVNWNDYERLFLAALSDDVESMEIIRLREGPAAR